MGLEAIKEEDKRILEEIASDFSNIFLKKGKLDQINLYGIGEPFLRFFKEQMQGCFQNMGKNIPLVFGHDGSYKIDVGHFFRCYKALGLNPHYLINN